MNIPQQIKDIKLPDLPQAIKDLKFWPLITAQFQNIDIATFHLPADCKSLLEEPPTAKYTWLLGMIIFISLIKRNKPILEV